MILAWTPHAWEEYVYWQVNDKKIVKRINELIKDIQRSPFVGLGKPEPLKFHFSGYWSRRVNSEHRLVYKFENDLLTIIQCQYHT